MQGTTSKPVCWACGDRIGVYEPIWLTLDDGTVVMTALLNLDDHRSRMQSDARLFHVSCLESGDREVAALEHP
jgi:hypothetical protein